MSSSAAPRARGESAVSCALAAWYADPLGGALFAAERSRLEAVLPQLFGYHVLQLGQGPGDLLASSRIAHRVVIAPLLPADPGTSSQVRAAPAALPVASDSVDVVLLVHTLDVVADPHQSLREVHRVLMPEGHAIVLGYNPWSLWGVWRLCHLRRRPAPWCGRFLSMMRVRDWLELLGFEVVETSAFFFRPPIANARLMERLNWLERAGGRWWQRFGAAYMMVAKKRVISLTPVRPRWRSPHRVLSPGLAEPTARGGAAGRGGLLR